MNTLSTTLTIASVCLATLLIGVYGLKISRTTSDFYVASRTVKPWWNASAIGGEYLSAASFLGVAGLIVTAGREALWYPVGYTAGYLMLLLFVAAPLRRSGAYTISDFAAFRLESARVRTVTSVLVVIVGWLYIVPQLQGAGLTIRLATGMPSWVGALVVILVVVLSVIFGGMRSITFVQAFQFWLKLTAIAVPVILVLAFLGARGLNPLADPGNYEMPEITAGSFYATASLVVALLFGTLGLPHVLVRFYTNPDGNSARRTTVIVLGLLALFYIFPTIFGVLGRAYAEQLGPGNADGTVLLLPSLILPGIWGEITTAMVTAGAFAAFLSTTSGLVISLAGVMSQEVFRGSVAGFRVCALVAALIPLPIALATGSQGLAGSVGMVFAFTASTICPLLVLGIWWRSLTDVGALAGMGVGAVLCGTALVLSATGVSLANPVLAAVIAQPALLTVPSAFVVMMAVSVMTRSRVSSRAGRILARLHVPERG